MKKTKPTSAQKCDRCSERASHRANFLNPTQYACGKHKSELQAVEDSKRDDGHMSEGDYQSWGRL